MYRYITFIRHFLSLNLTIATQHFEVIKIFQNDFITQQNDNVIVIYFSYIKSGISKHISIFFHHAA